MSGAKHVALALFEALNRHDADAALASFDDDASFEIVPAQLRGTAANEGRGFLRAWLTAFPDLLVRPIALLEAADVAVARVTVSGTQAAELLGVLNQEKHIDLEQAWIVGAANDRVRSLRVYYCQNQLYRRLAVRRLDRVSILG